MWTGKSKPHRAGDICFVHPDGHIETFRMRGAQDQCSNASASDSSPPLSRPSTATEGDGRRHRDRHYPADRANTPAVASGNDYSNASIAAGMDDAGDCPPSYEEALHMPTLDDSHAVPLYVNLDDKNQANHEENDNHDT
jgi:hypothetical protein